MTLYYRIRLEYDGSILECSHLPEHQARDWLWRILSRGTVQSSRIVIQSVSIGFYDTTARMYGLPGDLDPLTGKPLSFV